MIKEIEAYECEVCGEIYKREADAARCFYDHAKERYANVLLDEKRGLRSINYLCGFDWTLTPEREQITKDNCFVISHWQCCDKPAYRIVEINSHGKVRLWGIGGWMGGYGNWMDIDKLPQPHEKEELYVYEKSG